MLMRSFVCALLILIATSHIVTAGTPAVCVGPPSLGDPLTQVPQVPITVNADGDCNIRIPPQQTPEPDEVWDLLRSTPLPLP